MRNILISISAIITSIGVSLASENTGPADLVFSKQTGVVRTQQTISGLGAVATAIDVYGGPAMQINFPKTFTKDSDTNKEFGISLFVKSTDTAAIAILTQAFFSKTKVRIRAVTTSETAKAANAAFPHTFPTGAERLYAEVTSVDVESD